MKYKNLEYEKQDFTCGTVKIIDNGNEVICDMFIDEDGDIGFFYDEEEIYLRQIKRK